MARKREEYLEEYWEESSPAAETEELECEGLNDDELPIEGVWFVHGYDD